MPNSRRVVAAIAVAAIAMLTALAPNGTSAAGVVSSQATLSAPPATPAPTAVVAPTRPPAGGPTPNPTPDPAHGTKASHAPSPVPPDPAASFAPAAVIRDDDATSGGDGAPIVAPVVAPLVPTGPEPAPLPWLALLASSVAAFLGLLLFAGLSATFADPAPGRSLGLLRGRVAGPAGDRSSQSQ